MKNLAKYSSLEDIGTTHWFRTLVSEAKHMGEFLGKADNISRVDYCTEYGQRIKNIMSDLIEWQETHTPLRNQLAKELAKELEELNAWYGQQTFDMVDKITGVDIWNGCEDDELGDLDNGRSSRNDLLDEAREIWDKMSISEKTGWKNSNS